MASLVEEVTQFVAEKSNQMGTLKVNHVQNNTEKYFNLTVDELQEMNKEECITAQYLIIQYTYSITHKVNSEKFKLAANQKTFNRYLSKVYNDYSSFDGGDIVRAKACVEHEHLRLMDNEITKIQAIIQEYEGLTFKAEKLAQVFKDLSFLK